MRKIIGVPGDKVQGACAHYRTIWPLEEIYSYGWAETYVPPAINGRLTVEFNQGNQKDASNPNLVNNYDMVVFQRQPEADIQQLMQGCQYYGIKIVYDIDDAALSIPKTNPNYATWGRDKRHVYQIARRFMESGYVPEALRGKTPEQAAEEAPKRLKQLLNNIRQADMVTVTTEALRQEYSAYNDNIVVLPNQARVSHWEDAEPIAHPNEIWIGWAGGWTHGSDLKMLRGPIREITRRYDNVRFVIVGFEQAYPLLFNDIPEDRVKLFPWHSDFKSYHNAVASMDIVLAPSEDNKFNAAKSDIRILEAWLCGAPCIASPTTYGNTIKESGGGIVAKNTKHWLKALKRLVESKQLRIDMGQCGKRYVIQNRTYRGNAYRWWDAYQMLFDGG